MTTTRQPDPTKKSGGRPPTPVNERLLLELTSKGIKPKSIAKDFCVPVAIIYSRLSKLRRQEVL